MFETWAMQFGATAAVTHSNRVPSAIECILAKELWVAVSCYVDDFALVSPRVLASSVDHAAKELFDILGPGFKAFGSLL